MTLHLRPAPIVASLAFLVVIFALAGTWAGIERTLPTASAWFASQLTLFDLSCENNVPTWFSTSLLMGCAGIALALGAGSGRFRRRWWCLAAVLAAISLAEDASLLERSLDVFAHEGNFGLPFSAWRWIAVGGAAVLGLAFAPLIGTLSPRRALLVVVAVGLFCVGHWAFASLGGWLAWHHGAALSVVGARVAEETSKMLGETAGAAALLGELRARGGVVVRLG